MQPVSKPQPVTKSPTVTKTHTFIRAAGVAAVHPGGRSCSPLRQVSRSSVVSDGRSSTAIANAAGRLRRQRQRQVPAPRMLRRILRRPLQRRRQRRLVLRQCGLRGVHRRLRRGLCRRRRRSERGLRRLEVGHIGVDRRLRLIDDSLLICEILRGLRLCSGECLLRLVHAHFSLIVDGETASSRARRGGAQARVVNVAQPSTISLKRSPARTVLGPVLGLS